MARIPFFSVRHQPPTHRRWLMMVLSFALPMLLWCAVSYVPFFWHPLMEIQLGGGPVFVPGDRIPKASYAELQNKERLWFTQWQENGARIDGQWVPGPDQDPVSAGRRLNRSNTKAFYSYAPVLIANELLDEKNEREALLIFQALQAWKAEQFKGHSLTLSDENKRRVEAVITAVTIDDTGTALKYPAEAVLPAAALQGVPANPVFLPAPHEVAVSLVTAFTTPPPRDGDPWLHERLVHSLWIVVKGFGLALLIGLPIGILAGTFPALSRLFEPVTNFIGYIPPPAFAALLVAIFGLQDGPKVGIVFIASVFPMITMVANTVRSLDTAFIEAAQTLGATKKRLVMRVIIPGSLPRIFDDLRVLLALGWTILIIAEITGEKSGLSAYMEQQGRYRHYEAVFAAMLIIGFLGLVVDQFLAAIKPKLFPWLGGQSPRWVNFVTHVISYLPKAAVEQAEQKERYLAEYRESLKEKGSSG